MDVRRAVSEAVFKECLPCTVGTGDKNDLVCEI